MKRFNSSVTTLRCLFGLVVIAILAGCASIGRPGGGPRDEQPPVFLRSTPAQGALNVDRQRLELYFDENVQLDDAFNKVIVSPSQKMAPVVRSQGRRVTVELRDTLLPDETYTIDFGDAIKDLNEGNILDGFALDFSTGDTIDSLRISGVVLEARTLEPAQGILVGVYSNMADSALSTLPLERVARTNSRGQFTVRGLKDKPYRVFAINDINRDNRWDRSEDVAFYDGTVRPSIEHITVNDTLRNVEGQDSIVTRPGVAYLPADVLLTWFNEDYKARYMTDYGRPARNRVTVNLSAPTDSVVRASIVRTPALDSLVWDEITVKDVNPTNDSITWWIRDPRALAVDSLTLALSYPRTDSLENIVMYNDTVRVFYRPTSDEVKKAKEKAKLRENGADTIPEPQIFMEVRPTTGSSHDIYMPLYFDSSTPWKSIDSTLVRLTMLVDSVWQPVDHSSLTTVDGATILRRRVDFDRKPGQKYKFEADSAAFYDIYDNPSKKLSHEFTVKDLDAYSKIIFNITPAEPSIMVELLDSSDKVVRAEKSDGKGKVVFNYVNPGTYYARMYYDDNDDGQWTTGNIAQDLQPEEVSYYPKKIDARANWDVDLTWDIYQIPIDVQKPYAILKNKPKLKKGETAPEQEEEQETDEWGRPINRNDRTAGNRNFNSTTNSFNQIRNSGILR